MTQKLEYTVLDLIESAARTMKAQPLNLGGITGAGGGVGAPPAGYIGWLPQTRVAYDETEAATLFTPASGMSLLDNLNHIRYRLGVVESGGALVVDEWDGTPTIEGVNHITFSGGADVVDLGGGHVLVIVTASGGGGTPENTPDRLAIFDENGDLNTDEELYYDSVNKLLFIGPFRPSIGSTPGAFAHSAPSGVSAGFLQFAVGDSATVAPYEAFFKARGSYDSPQPVRDADVIGRVRGRPHDDVDWENTQAEMRYVVVGDHDSTNHGTKIDFYTTPSGSTTLTKVFTIDHDGNVNLQSGKTYNIAGTPHSHTSALQVEEVDGSPIVTSVDRIIFSGASVYDLGGGDTLVAISGGGGGTPLVVEEADGSPSVSNVDKIIFSGATVTDLGDGDVLVTISGGLGTTHEHRYIEETGITDRWLHKNVTVPSGHSLVLVDYLNLNGYDMTLEGDAAVAIINGDPIDNSGWIPITSTLSYSSADSPTFVISTPSDLTGIIGVGYRIKLTQTTIKYFIVTAITSTTMTVYGGTDYTLTNTAIESPSWSNAKAPQGFPLSPAKWTVEVSSTSEMAKASPTADVWYGDTGLSATGLSISVPIGVWKLEYLINIYGSGNVNGPNCYATLSTASNSESDADFTSFVACYFPSAAATNTTYAPTTKPKVITLASKTTYYLNVKTSVASMGSIGINGSVVKAIVRAICQYL